MDLIIIEVSLLILLLLLLIYQLYKYIIKKNDTFSISNNILMQSSVDGNKYYVHSHHKNLQLAADTFSLINKKVNQFLSYIYKKYKNSANKKRKEVALLMERRYNINNVRENSPLNIEGDTSYTINKGDIIAVCIRNGFDYGIHDNITIMFVVLHELTHLAVKSYDHPDEFWQVFKFILLESSESGIYTSPNYSKNPVEYCGININYNPMYDDNIQSV